MALMVSPEPTMMSENNPIDFRAPPPSPIASGRRSSVANDDVLTEFLEHSLRVPDLVLPDKIFPRQKILETPPRIDFQSWNGDSICKMLDSMSRIGCFQLVNYGIPSDSVRSVRATAAGIFTIPPEKRATVARSPEKLYGFEEVHGEEEETDLTEEFVWYKDKDLKADMEGIWPSGYSNFSDKMETLVSKMDNIAEKIVQIFQENSHHKEMYGSDLIQGEDQVGSVCYVYKHKTSRWASSLGYDVIRMLIRGSDHSHALCLHTCDGSSEFHVYSRKGWVSFCPDKDAIIVTVGDQTQTLSGGQYRHVIGRPMFKSEKEDGISMAFLYSPPSRTTTTSAAITTTKPEEGKTISLGQQVVVAIFLTLFYHFLAYVYKKF